MTAAHIQEK